MKKLLSILAWFCLVQPLCAITPTYSNPTESISLDMVTRVVLNRGVINFPLGELQISNSSALDVFALSTNFFQSLASIDDPDVMRQILGAEADLGSPPDTGYFLTSSPYGERSWQKGTDIGTGVTLFSIAPNDGVTGTVSDPMHKPQLKIDLQNITPDNIVLPVGGFLYGATIATPDSLTTAEIDWTKSNTFIRHFATNTTLTFSGAAAGQPIQLWIQMDSASTLTWPGSVSWPPGGAPIPTPDRTDLYQCQDLYGSVYCYRVADFAPGASPTPTVTPNPTPVPTPTPPPDGTISAPAGNIGIVAGGSVTFAGSGIDPGGLTPLTYLWNFGSGSGLSNSTTQNPGAKTFSTSGTFVTSFTVTNSAGIADPTPDQRTVTVAPSASPTPTPVPTSTPTPTATPTATPVPTPTPPPVITKQPVSKTVTAGQSVTFSVTASGVPILDYQWKANGQSVAGATASSYTKVTTLAMNGQSINVLVTNPGGSVLSATAILTVTAGSPTPTPKPTSTPTATPTPTPAVVVAPILNPSGAAGFTPSRSVTVTITTSTTGAQMRYTTDGSTPTTTNGTLIAGTSGTVTIAKNLNVTLQAVAFKTGLTTSSVTSGFYDTSDPTQ